MAGDRLVSGLLKHLAHSMPEGVGRHSQGHGVRKRVPQSYGTVEGIPLYQGICLVPDEKDAGER